MRQSTRSSEPPDESPDDELGLDELTSDDPAELSLDEIAQGAEQSPARRRRGCLLLVVAFLVVGAAVGGFLVFVDARLDGVTRPPERKPFEVAPLEVRPGSAAPRSAAVPVTDPQGLADWLARVADRTDIPVRALRAYAEAELAMRSRSPSCGITWTTLAGIGRVESKHGQINGTRLGDDGRVSPPIIGPPLDGSPGFAVVPDTDKGALDGDRTWDRAIGPMQFLPATWARWATRASGDGAKPDPQDIDDAALSAARYLCASSRDANGGVTSAKGWWAAVLTYNQSVEYGEDVFSGADAYAAVGL